MEASSLKRHYVTMQETEITEPFLVKLKAVIDNDPNLTAAGLAVRAGLTNSAIRTMLAKGNQSPRISSARKICAALGTTLEEFMSNAQTPEEQEIVSLVSQLPEHLRHKLLSYGQGLLDAEDPSPEATSAIKPQDPDLK